MKQPQRPTERRRPKFSASDGSGKKPQLGPFWLGLILAVVVLVVYAQVFDHDFVSYDDPDYVSQNPYVRGGLTRGNVVWAFSAGHAGNWHPLTWLSHMLDVQLFGLNAGPHHLTNVVLHAASALLLFLTLNRMTGAFWQSAFVSALFALHPLRVESVAWVAERKDALSTFFWMVTLWFYARYVEQPDIKRYLTVLGTFALGLMAKPMLVTIPFVLLLLDFWPLGRTPFTRSARPGAPWSVPSVDRKSIALKLIWEKIPFVALAALSSLVTFYVQRSSGAVATVDVLPLGPRIENALLSFVRYIGKFLWPSNLAVFYPYPPRFPWWQVAAAGVVLLSASFLFLRWSKSRPYLAVGWFWYLGTLVPVIGIVQVGIQAMADRYTYVPLVGVYILIAWGGAEFLERWSRGRMALCVAAGFAVVVCTISTWYQLEHWKNSATLFQHALEATENNFVAHNDLGSAIEKQGRVEEAVAHYREALRIKPDFVLAQSNIGAALGKLGQLEEGIVHIKEALRLKPDHADAHNNLGIAFALQGKTEDAVRHFSDAIRFRPEHANAHFNLGHVFLEQGKLDEAISHLLDALRIDPDHAQARADLNKARLLKKQAAFRNQKP